MASSDKTGHGMSCTIASGPCSRLIWLSQCMSEHAGRFGGVANRALAQRTWAALQTNKLDGVVGLSAGRDGMRTVVASFTINPSMACRLAIERLCRVITGTVAAGGAAFRLDQPWRLVLSNNGDITVAIGAIHAEIL